MAHKAFEIIGEKLVIVDSTWRNKEGIFLESERFNTTAEGPQRPALDFIEPIYNPNPVMEDFARGKIPKERVDPENPILSIHAGVDHLLLTYQGRRNGSHLFVGRLEYVQGMFINDGNPEIFNKYVRALQRVGFRIR